MYIDGKNMVKKYGKGTTELFALNQTDISIKKGEVAVVLGPSGSGKSTLLNILGGLDKLDTGSVVVGGEKLETMNERQLSDFRRNKVGFVFQSYNLTPDLNAYENIVMTAELVKNPLAINEIVEELGISEYKLRFPNELSGGQQQRVAIARAMVKNPELLLCDELTGALDSRASQEVLKLIEKVNQQYGTTVVIITHNEVIAGMADRIIRIKDGKVVSNILNEKKISATSLEI